MGCVSSTLLNQQQQQEASTSSFGHHIVCLTSSTYGRLLSLDPPPISSDEPEIINSWDLMAGLDLISNNNESSTSFRGFPRPNKTLLVEDDEDKKEKEKENSNPNPNPNPNAITSDDDDEDMKKDKENSNPNVVTNTSSGGGGPVLSSSDDDVGLQSKMKVVCRPPKGGEDKVVVYTTSLGTVRKTLEECKAVKAVFKGMGVAICERDISMDIGWRQELKDLLLFLNLKNTPTPPRVFIKGRYLGGAEELMRIAEQGLLPDLLQGLPKLKFNTNNPTPLACCHGCGGVRFVPCLSCNGSCKKLLLIRSSPSSEQQDLLKDSTSTTTTSRRRRRSSSTTSNSTLIVQCPHCNENGLMLCQICT